MPSKWEIEQVQFAKWYSREALARKSFKSCIVKLPATFVSYLGEDGIIVPASLGGKEGGAHGGDEEDADGDTDDYEDDNIDDGDDDDEKRKKREERTAAFSSLHSEIKSAIWRLEGAVFPKLNWSSPQDASWMNAGSLKCYHPEDIVILLKASDRISYDLNYMLPTGEGGGEVVPEQPAEAGPDREIILVLRKWANLNPSMEFRFFVRNRKLVGLCQRDTSTFYDFLAVEEERDRIEGLLLDFYYDGYANNHYTRDDIVQLSGATELETTEAETVTDTEGQAAIEGETDYEEAWLARELGMESFTLDVYVDRSDRVWIVDFNVYGEPTDALLYSSFEELDELQADSHSGVFTALGAAAAANVVVNNVNNEILLKVVNSERERTIRRRADLSSNTGPIDVTEAPDFHQFMRVLEQQRSDDHEEGDRD